MQELQLGVVEELVLGRRIFISSCISHTQVSSQAPRLVLISKSKVANFMASGAKIAKAQWIPLKLGLLDNTSL